MALCYKVNWRTKGTLLLKKRKVGIAGPLGHGVRDERPLQDCGAGGKYAGSLSQTQNPELQGRERLNSEVLYGMMGGGKSCGWGLWIVFLCYTIR